jgi:hypothetical protein
MHVVSVGVGRDAGQRGNTDGHSRRQAVRRPDKEVVLKLSHIAVSAVVLLLGVGLIAAQRRPLPDPTRARGAPVPDAGARAASARERIRELRDDFLRRTVVQPFLQKGNDVRAAVVQESLGQAGVIAEPVAGQNLRPGSCVDVLCSYLGPLACTTESGVLDAARACAGNYSGDCLRTACRRVGHLECNSFSQAQRLALACSFNISGACLEEGCRRVGPLGCEDVFDVTRVLDGCAGNRDDACVQDVCSRLGELGCTTISGFAQVAQACAREY